MSKRILEAARCARCRCPAYGPGRSRRPGCSRRPDPDLLQGLRASRRTLAMRVLGIRNGKTSIRTGWGLFYNPMEQLVLEQFGAEPPFGGSTYLPSTFFNTPFIAQTGTRESQSIHRDSQPRTWNSAGLGYVPPHAAVRGFPAAHAHAVHGAIQLHDSAGIGQGCGAASWLRRIAGTSIAGFA